MHTHAPFPFSATCNNYNDFKWARRLQKTRSLIKNIESGLFYPIRGCSSGAAEVISSTSICREELMNTGVDPAWEFHLSLLVLLVNQFEQQLHAAENLTVPNLLREHQFRVQPEFSRSSSKIQTLLHRGVNLIRERLKYFHCTADFSDF